MEHQERPTIEDFLKRMLALLDEPWPALNLVGKEKEVARLVSRGLSRAEVAERLDISESSAKRYAVRVSAKAGIPARKFSSHLVHELEMLIKEALQ